MNTQAPPGAGSRAAPALGTALGIVLGAVLALVAGWLPARAAEPAMTETQKASYALGVFFSQSLAQQPIELDREHFLMAVDDVLKGKEPRLSQGEMQAIFAKLQQQEQTRRASEAERNRAAGQRFLEENRDQEGVVALASGLQYKALRPGDGDSPTPGGKVTVHYRGTLLDGAEFDSSYARKAPLTLSLNGVIKGWQEALPLMKAGAKWRLYVPPELAYGAAGQGPIGPNQTLIFDVELLETH